MTVHRCHLTPSKPPPRLVIRNEGVEGGLLYYYVAKHGSEPAAEAGAERSCEVLHEAEAAQPIPMNLVAWGCPLPRAKELGYH